MFETGTAENFESTVIGPPSHPEITDELTRASVVFLKTIASDGAVATLSRLIARECET
jgi:hypothetical protein